MDKKRQQRNVLLTLSIKNLSVICIQLSALGSTLTIRKFYYSVFRFELPI